MTEIKLWLHDDNGKFDVTVNEYKLFFIIIETLEKLNVDAKKAERITKDIIKKYQEVKD